VVVLETGVEASCLCLDEAAVSKIKVLRERDEKQSNEQAAAVWRDEQFGFISRRANNIALQK
jgi:hypothetical protein